MLHPKYLSKLGASLALSIPFLAAESKQGKSKDNPKNLPRKLKPSQLPLYEDPQDIFCYEYHGKEKNKLEEGISVVREELVSTYDATAGAREGISNFLETGKAHSMATADYLWDEDNIAAKVGAITAGGLLGLLIGGRKKGFIKKIMYASAGATAAAGTVYPKESVKMGRDVFDNAESYSIIAYNFITGVKPQSELKSAPASETPKKVIPVPPAAPSEKIDAPVVPGKGSTKDVVVKVTPKPLSPPVEGDLGQSNPKDKDMYTTRS